MSIVKAHKLSHILLEVLEADTPQLAFTCWKLTTETLEQGVKYVQI